jgi:SMC interacting uncharacterized protein involved in chromosome segregation
LSSEVASLSIARAERDSIIVELRQSVKHHESKCDELKQELQELHVALHEANKESESYQETVSSLEDQITEIRENHVKELEELSKNSEMELQEAISSIEIEMGKAVSKLHVEKDKLSKEVEHLQSVYERDMKARSKDIERISEEYEVAICQLEDEHIKHLSKVRQYGNTYF